MYIFPVHLLPPLAIEREPRDLALSGGTALTGDTDVILSDGGGRWEIEYNGIELVTPDDLRVWDAWTAYLSGGVNPCLVPLLTLATGPRPKVAGRPLRPSGLYVDDDEWPTEMRYSVADHEARISAAAALRATQVEILVDKGPAIKSGHHFGVGADRAYRVVRPLGANLFSILPPLRSAVDEDTAADFHFPLVRAKLDPQFRPGASLYGAKYGTVSLRFLEAF